MYKFTEPMIYGTSMYVNIENLGLNIEDKIGYIFSSYLLVCIYLYVQHMYVVYMYILPKAVLMRRLKNFVQLSDFCNFSNYINNLVDIHICIVTYLIYVVFFYLLLPFLPGFI